MPRELNVHTIRVSEKLRFSLFFFVNILSDFFPLLFIPTCMNLSF